MLLPILIWPFVLVHGTQTLSEKHEENPKHRKLTVKQDSILS